MLARATALSARVARRSALPTAGRSSYATAPGSGSPLGKEAEQNQRNTLLLGGGALAALGAWYFMKSSPEARKEYEHIKEGVKQNPGPAK